jgi:hypothetical protein
MPRTCIDTADAMELAETLQLIAGWLTADTALVAARIPAICRTWRVKVPDTFRLCWTPAMVRSIAGQPDILNLAAASVLPPALFLNARFTTPPVWAGHAYAAPGEARLNPSMRPETCRTRARSVIVADTGLAG